MSEENVEVVRGMFDAWNRREFDDAQEPFDPEIVAEMHMGGEFDGTYEGLEQFQRVLSRFWGSFAEFRSEPEELLTNGDEVYATVHHQGRGRQSGAEVEMRNFQVFTLRDGRIVRYRIYGTRQEALDAAGIDA